MHEGVKTEVNIECVCVKCDLCWEI
jgi:hypothetical protein